MCFPIVYTVACAELGIDRSNIVHGRRARKPVTYDFGSDEDDDDDD
jgi:hypothetical protein